MHEHARRDDELATFTNQLLAGEEPEKMSELDDLARVVRQLHDTIAPYEKPTPTFRTQLAQRLEMEWNLQYRKAPRWWHTRRIQQMVALAAGLLVLVAATLWLSGQHEDSVGPLKGTALGPTTGALVVLVVVLGGLGLIMLYRRKR